MLERSAERHDFNPESLAADKAYGPGAFLAWLLDKEIAPHVPVLDRKHQTKGKLSKDHFSYDPETDSFTCLEGQTLALSATNPGTRIKHYRAERSTCGSCEIRKACTDSDVRTVSHHMDEGAREIARELAHTDAFDESARKRKKVEMLFAHLKRNFKVTRLRDCCR